MEEKKEEILSFRDETYNDLQKIQSRRPSRYLKILVVSSLYAVYTYANILRESTARIMKEIIFRNRT
jgi:hypothetical protein